MKYVAIVVLIFMVVRIDFIMGLFERQTSKSESTPVNVDSSEVKASRETISFKDDKALKQTPRETFFALMDSFHISPTADLRLKIIEVLKASPTMFTPKQDREFELALYKWRELLNNNEPELVNILLELLTYMPGENKETVKKFFSLWMEINIEHFVAAYSRTTDANCTIATYFGDPIPEEEKLNEYYDREDAFKEFVAKEKIEPAHKALAQNCILQLSILIEKIKPKTPAEPEPAPVVDPDNKVQTMESEAGAATPVSP